MGAFEVPTFGHGKYVMTIRYLSTSYNKVKILATKGDAAKLLIEKVLHFETATGKKVKCILSNNGSKFESKVLINF